MNNIYEQIARKREEMSNSASNTIPTPSTVRKNLQKIVQDGGRGLKR